MQFRVRTFDARSGAVAERMMAGESAQLIRQALESEGVTVLAVDARQRWRFPRRQAGFNVALFCEELRTLLSSGMSLVEAVDALCSKNTDGGKHAILLEIKQRLQEGKPLSSALESSRFGFPALLIAAIRASERTSRIEEALGEYIEYDNVARELAKKVVSAAIYPSMVIGFGMLVCLFMISYVVPRFARVYDDFGQALSFSTVILMKAGQLAGDHFGVLLSSIVLGVLAVAILYRTGRLRRLFLLTLGKFRFARYYLRLYQLARIYQTLSMLLRGGYTLSDAMVLAKSLAFEAEIANHLAHARQAVMEGKRMSSAFASHQLTDSVTERLLQVGERSGDLAKVLDIIAQSHRQEFMLFMERATRLAEPVLLMAVGLMIGAIIILMYMPVFDLAGGI